MICTVTLVERFTTRTITCQSFAPQKRKFPGLKTLTGAQIRMSDCLSQYYRCPRRYARFATQSAPSAAAGYFQFGEGSTCYGSYRGAADSSAGLLRDALEDVVVENGTTYLPFDASQVAENLRCELYDGKRTGGSPTSVLGRLYYFLRPVLPARARTLLKKLYLTGWDRVVFPRWPVDCSVDNLLEQLLLLSVRANDGEPIPFIWFWPDGASACAMMTHDVETKLGLDFCSTLMDIDESYGIKAAFQIIPEQRYKASRKFLASICDRGFEVCIQDLNHDGQLYRDRSQFLRRAAKINAYGREYGANGFRAGVLYRRQNWFDALDFSYDMSVPNVAHLDPQHGGCCTVMPYFIGHMLELPVTTTQDYMLFHILNDYSINLWRRQTELILEKHGLMSFIVHPDYIVKARELAVYEELLGHLTGLKKERDIWIPTPGEVNRWWRQRTEMRLIEAREGWRIEGPGSERACLAWASESAGRLVFTLPAKVGQETSVR